MTGCALTATGGITNGSTACITPSAYTCRGGPDVAVRARVRRALVAPNRLNEIWVLDVMHDTLYGGRRFRTLNVLDEGHREGLANEVGTSIPVARVVLVLDQLVVRYGRPQALRLDDGPKLTAQVRCRLASPAGYRPVRHPAGQARAERHHRTVQPNVPRGGPRCLSVGVHAGKCSSSPMPGSSPTTSTGPTTRWVGYRRSRTWRASERVQSPAMRGPLDGEAFPFISHIPTLGIVTPRGVTPLPVAPSF